MKLQQFIEQNAGKVYGDAYLYEGLIVQTRFCLATEPDTVEASIALPWGWSFKNCFDDREISDNVDFYKWLTESFFPLAEHRSFK